MRRLTHPITVELDRRGRPLRLSLGGRWRAVSCVVDSWVEAGCWWDGELPRRFFRVEAEGLFDLSCGRDGHWRLEVVYD